MKLKRHRLFREAENALDKNDYQNGERLLTEVISQGESVEVLLQRSLVRVRLKQFNDAISDARRAMELHPENALGPMILGEALLEMGDFAEAEKAYLEAIKIEKDNGRAYWGLGKACAFLGKRLEAADYFELALQFERDYCLAHFMAEVFSQRRI